MFKPCLCLFAKVPLAGQVKTRLASHCGEQKAAQIATALLESTLELATSCWQGEVILYVWPDHTHELITPHTKHFGIRARTQSAGDLGEKMRNALQEGVTEFGAAAVMGCDVPHCGSKILEIAYQFLARGENVFGPAEDGGFYFLGVHQTHDNMFADITWGSSDVARHTLNQCKNVNIEFDTILPTLQDIDTWQDFSSIASTHATLAKFL